MNRNVESHFASNPTSLDISRSQFDRSSTVKLTGNAGECIPFYWDEVLPGDTFKIKTSKIIRLQTLLAPIMDNVYLDTYWFFCPNRLIWDHWKEFMGESDNAWLPNVEYTVPRLRIGSTNPGIHSLADYMGVPVDVIGYAPSDDFPEDGLNALPFRAYAKVMDDWFRDENLTDPLVIDTGDSTQLMNDTNADDIYCALGGPVFHAAKYHDYFTSCLPAPQKGPEVTINPTKEFIPVAVNSGVHSGIFDENVPFYWSSLPNGENLVYSARNSGTWPPAEGSSAGAIWSNGAGYGMYPRNLYADLRDSFNVTINDLRLAFQIQKFYEKAARGGTRYIETLKAQFGVTSPDARLQRTEYLGGNRVPLNIHEVTANATGENEFVGDLGAMSRTGDVHDDCVFSSSEHGILLGIMVVRYDHTYGQGIPTEFDRLTKFDYYWPVFANIGERPVLKKTLYFNNTDTGSNHDVFGYQEAWAEYRYKPNRCCGLMRPEASGSLSHWNLADYYLDEPSLSDSWIREDKAMLDRCLAVPSTTSGYQFFADIYVQNIASRCMPVYSVPGLIDHH